MHAVARRRWSAVLIAGSALAPKGTCVRLWRLQSGRSAPSLSKGTAVRIRAGAAPQTNAH
jgi:hypothetical protein